MLSIYEKLNRVSTATKTSNPKVLATKKIVEIPNPEFVASEHFKKSNSPVFGGGGKIKVYSLD